MTDFSRADDAARRRAGREPASTATTRDELVADGAARSGRRPRTGWCSAAARTSWSPTRDSTAPSARRDARHRAATDGVSARPDRGGRAVGCAWSPSPSSTGWRASRRSRGIPGTAGAAPIQNIGAYGQQLSDTLVAIDFLDFESGEVVTLAAAELELGYRTSALKRGRLGVVLALELELHDDGGLERAGRLRAARVGARRRARRARAARRRAGAPCSRCARARGWCWTPPTPTR